MGQCMGEVWLGASVHYRANRAEGHAEIKGELRYLLHLCTENKKRPVLEEAFKS